MVPPKIVFVIGGYNGLTSVRSWADQLLRNSSDYTAYAYSWRDARSVIEDIAKLRRRHVTLIGHSLGGCQAELLVQQLPAGTVGHLITVASFGKNSIDHAQTRQKVKYWLNIMSTPDKLSWQDLARNAISPVLVGCKEQGFISEASENYHSHYYHHDFYKMMTDRCGAVEHGQFKVADPFV